MNKDDEQATVLQADKRGRVSLGPAIRGQIFLVTQEPDGSLILTPAVAVPVTQKEYPGR